MKKYLIGLVALLVVATGCGNKGKELTCTGDENGVKRAITINFDGNDKAKKITITGKNNYEREITKEELEASKPYLDTLCDSYPHEAADCEVNADTKGLEIVVVYDITKMTNEEIEELGFDDATLTYENAKEHFEEDGLTCK